MTDEEESIFQSGDNELEMLIEKKVSCYKCSKLGHYALINANQNRKRNKLSVIGVNRLDITLITALITMNS